MNAGTWHEQPTSLDALVDRMMRERIEAATREPEPEPVVLPRRKAMSRKEPKPLPASTEWNLSTQGAADFLGCHYQFVYRLAREGGIPCTRIGNRWRFSEARLREWVEKNAVAS